jgi:LmbE family N-acetylglucosaminyl deacetylase
MARPGLVLVLVALAAWVAMAAQSAVGRADPLPIDFVVDQTTRLLVIAPHPDDESLGAAGLIRRVMASGGSVRVVWMTSGDGFPEGVETERGITHPRPSDYRSYGMLREREARAATGEVGVPERSLTFLGFPDGGLCELASTYLSTKIRAFESPFTDRTSPPPGERVLRGVRYRGTDVRRELEQVIASFAPTQIATVHPEDEHPDHCSTYIFVREALDNVQLPGHPKPPLLHYLVHYGSWPLTPDAGAGSQLAPPAGFPSAEGRWVSLSLTPDEVAAKKRALLEYKSQLLVIGRFMLAFARGNELFLEGEPASLPECWCDNGENVATELPPAKYRRRPFAR